MSGSLPLAYPAAGTLSAWWRQLAPLHPRSGWVAHLFVHRVDAPVTVAVPRRLDGLEALLLHAARVEPAAPPPLPMAIVQRVYRDLAGADLVKEVAGTWKLTVAGADALASGLGPRREMQRRVFTFVERLDGQQRRVAAPHYLALAAAPPRPWKPGEDCAFALDRLTDAIARPNDWKTACGFPPDVIETPRASPDWRRVVLVRPEHHLAIIVDVPDETTPLQGFAIRPETMMPSTTPLFALSAAARPLLPDLFPTSPTGAHATNEFDLFGDGLSRGILRRFAE